MAAGRPEITSEHAFPDPHEIPAERILELNQQALDYFESRYPRSWAPAYMRVRLGTDLTDPPPTGPPSASATRPAPAAA